MIGNSCSAVRYWRTGVAAWWEITSW